MAERDPRYFKVYQDGDDRELEQKIQQIVESGAAPGIDMVAREGVEEIQRKIESGEIGGGGGGAGVDPKAREDIQKVTEQLAITSKKQVDFVQLLQDHNEVASTLYAKVLGDRDIEVLIPFRGNLCSRFRIKKDVNDDYMKLQDGTVCERGVVPSKTGYSNYDSETGTYVKTQQNYYTTQVGATFTKTFTGTGFDFHAYTDTRGGIWEFVIDGDTANKHMISVWRSPSNSFGSFPIRGLSKGEHTVVATFKGADPDHPPTNSDGTPATARGWVKNAVNVTDESIKKNELNNTFITYDELMNYQDKFPIFVPFSNKEYAIRLRSTENTQDEVWFPDHGEGTVFAQSQEVFFDNNLITDWTPKTDLSTVKMVRVVQKMNGYHPKDKKNPIAQILSIHTVSARGVSIKVKFNFLKKTATGDGYGMMFPVQSSFAKKLVTSFGNSYDSTKTDGSRTTLTKESDQAISYAFINEGGTNGEPNTVVAMTIQNPEKTFRYGKQGRLNPLVWLQHRDAEMQKTYNQIFTIGTTVNAGDSYEVGGSYFIGELPMAKEMLI